MNKAILNGRLTKDPELKTTPSGISVCSFTLAVNRRFKNAEGGYDADFINCVAWRQQAEFITKYCSKGGMLGVVGNIQTRNYEKDGQRVYVTEIMVEEVQALNSKSNSEQTQGSNDAFNQIPNMPMPQDDDLPF